jgi:hypothetical protein
MLWIVLNFNLFLLWYLVYHIHIVYPIFLWVNKCSNSYSKKNVQPEPVAQQEPTV